LRDWIAAPRHDRGSPTADRDAGTKEPVAHDGPEIIEETGSTSGLRPHRRDNEYGAETSKTRLLALHPDRPQPGVVVWISAQAALWKTVDIKEDVACLALGLPGAYGSEGSSSDRVYHGRGGLSVRHHQVDNEMYRVVAQASPSLP